MGNLCYKYNKIELKNEININLIRSIKITSYKNLLNISWFNNFNILKEIGDGYNSNLYLVEKNKKLYVIKIIDLEKIKGHSWENVKEENKVLKIIKDNNFFIQIINNHKDNKNIYYLMEYANNGSLCDILILKKIKLGYNQIIYILFFLFKCIFNLNKYGILYNNIKLENILIDNNFNLKLSDFNLFCKVNEVFNFVRQEFNYFSPEKLMNKKLTLKSDVWSIGVVGYILIFNELPFNGNNRDEIIYKIISCNYNFPKKMDFKFEKFFKDVFRFNENERLGNNIEDIKNHILFNDFSEIEFNKVFNLNSNNNWIMTEDTKILEKFKDIKSESINKNYLKFNKFTYN